MDKHTLSWMRGGEYYLSPVVNHDGERGQPMLDRAHEQVQAILAAHSPSVAESVTEDLRRLLEEQR